MKIVFAASEAAPYIKTGGLGDVGQALPKALAALGHEVKVILPLYGKIKSNDSLMSKLSFVQAINTPLAWRNQYTGIFREGEGNNPEYVFIDNEYYFCRNNCNAIYGDGDDGERFAFFSRAIIESLGVIGFTPDVIHCNDWQTALTPVFLRKFYPQYNKTRTVFTIHNIEYQGKLPLEYASDVIGVDEGTKNALIYDNCINLMKGAIVFSDAVTTVSETYATEILSEYYSHGLHHVLRENRDKLSGIVNGIDTDVFDPSKSTSLYTNYSATVEGVKGKAQNKLFLQETLGLRPDKDAPIVAMVTRLASHKGLDLVACVINEIMNLGVQLVILGTGEQAYEDIMRMTAARYPGRMAAEIRFDAKLADQIYAGADIFLMPSKSEPCGLSQMVAMRYGTIPIVRETGGLKDTVEAYNPIEKTGRGFTFVDYNAHEMLRAVERCVDFYKNDKKGFDMLKRKNMKTDFSWGASVKKYLKVYKKPSKK